MIVGHEGTITIAGGSAIDCVIASFEPAHEWDEHEFKIGTGTTTGFCAYNERLRGRLTFRPYKASAPAVPATPAPFAAIVTASFSNTGGAVKGRTNINGSYYYKGNWSPRYVAGEIVEVSMDVWQGESIP